MVLLSGTSTASYSASIALQSTDFSETVSLPKFDPRLGILKSVYLTNTVTQQDQIQFENLSTTSGASNFSVKEEGVVTLSPPSNQALLPDPLIELDFLDQTPARTLTAFDGNLDYAGSSGYSNPWTTSTKTGSITLDSSTYDLSSYVLDPSLPDEVQQLQATLFGYSAKGSGGNVAVKVTTNVGADVSIVYTYIPYASLGDTVYLDSNADGVQETGEPGVQGVTVELLDGNGNPVLDASSQPITTTTDANGNYLFTKLLPGDYSVKFDLPPGYQFTKQTGTDATTDKDSNADVVTGKTNAVTLDGVDNLTLDAGLVLPAALSGNVYYDANNDGQFGATEAGIGGVQVLLTGTDYLGNPVSLSTTTSTAAGSVGAYSFPSLLPGTYTVTETQPDGYLDGKDTAGSKGGDATTVNDTISGITLGSGDDSISNNFGELLPASLSGYVYYDANNNGVKETGEAPIAGATVTLTGTDDLGNPVSTVVQTQTDGSYSFTGLRPGTYQIAETQPDGYLDGKDTIGTPGGTTSNDLFSSIVLAAGVNGVNNNFGELLPASISGTAWYDCNANATIDSGEVGRSGVTVYLDANNNGKLDSGETSTTTDANGNYSFNGLIPGAYVVREVVPLSFRQSTADPAAIALASNGSASSVNFGLTATTAGISNFTVLVNGTTTYGDLRNNTNAGDMVQITFTVAPGVVNLPVNLVSYTAPDASFVGSRAYLQKVFDVDGGLFSTGTYTLTVMNPHSYFQVDFVVGCVIDQLGGTAGKYDANDFYTPQGRLISADNGDSCSTAPLSNPDTITGTVYSDANCNGKLDGGEQGEGPIKVYLYGGTGCSTLVATAFTHADGTYKFDNLSPGSYSVRLTPPGGQSLTTGGSVSVAFSKGGVTTGGVNFGLKFASGDTVGLRTTESTSWWTGATGQSLISAFNGGSTSTSLGNWLASTFGNLFGSGSKYNASTGTGTNLNGATNAAVASYLKTLSSSSGKALEAQALTLALSMYATTSSLGGAAGVFYGFAVTSGGLGSSTYSVGSNGAMFGVANNSAISVSSMLSSINSKSSNGVAFGSTSSSSRSGASSVLGWGLAAGDAD